MARDLEARGPALTFSRSGENIRNAIANGMGLDDTSSPVSEAIHGNGCRRGVDAAYCRKSNSWADDEETDPLVLGETAAWWSVTDVAAPVVVVVAPPTREVLVTLACEATFGPLKYAWEAGPYDIGEGSSIEVELEVPAEVFQNELATSYVTDLLVRVDPVQLDGRATIGLTLPNVYIAWPDGGTSDPLVWSEADLLLYAPAGVLDPELAIGVARDGSARVLPPIWHLFSTGEVGAEEEQRGSETVPVDDQSDEGGSP